jgi:hypothetical protein
VQESHFPNTTVDREILAEALNRGAILGIGPYDSRFDLVELRSLLQRAFPVDDAYRRNQLVVPTALCVHWLAFCGRRHGLNRSYPVPRLRYLIEDSCGLPYFALPNDALLAALAYRGFSVERIKLSGFEAQYGWAANIRSVTYLPQDQSRLVPLAALGQGGVLPPIKIKFFLGDSR